MRKARSADARSRVIYDTPDNGKSPRKTLLGDSLSVVENDKHEGNRVPRQMPLGIAPGHLSRVTKDRHRLAPGCSENKGLPERVSRG